MVRSRLLIYLILCASLYCQQRGVAQEQSDTLSEIVNSVDTVVINERLPRYILRWTDKKRPPNEAHPNLNLDGKIEIRREDNTALVQTIVDSTEGISDVKIVDVNFDGYADLQLDHNKEAGLITGNSFFLFDKARSTFTYSNEFSHFTDVAVNPEDSLITSSIYRGNHGDEYKYYKVINGLPVLVKHVLNSNDTSLTAKLMNGKMKIVDQTTYEGISDTMCTSCTKVVHKKLAGNELIVVKEEILKPVEGEPTSKQRHNGLYQEDFRGKYLLQGELTYKYGKNKQGRKYRDVVRKSAINDRMKVTKKTREYLK